MRSCNYSGVSARSAGIHGFPHLFRENEGLKSLAELAAGKTLEAPMAPKQIHYTVKGHWPFPADMLRHDQSRAATAEDQSMIDRLSGDHAPDRSVFVDVEINLVGPNKPNTARWESFGWAVPSDTEHAFYRDMKRRQAEEQRMFDAAMAKLSDDERQVMQGRMRC